MQYDFAVIGGGIIGLSTAKHLLEQRSGASLILVEKAGQLAAHQTGHNSGVIHSGIYYAPGSLKAELCRQGCEETKQFCADHLIAYEVCGKLLVATDKNEASRMDALYRRSIENGVEVERLDSAQLSRVEPNITGVGALRVPTTGIVDYAAVTAAMAREIEAKGAKIVLGEAVTAIAEDGNAVSVTTTRRQIKATRLIACAGIQADRLARMAGLETEVRIVPFKGEYFRLSHKRNAIIEHLIYPIPDPRLPFLGIHLTRMIDGSVTVGPNAVLSLHREGYGKFDIDPRDAAEALLYPGLWRVILANLRSTAREAFNSLNRLGYLEQCRKYCPCLTLDDLEPIPPGIRAQAVKADGTLVHDFLFAGSERMVHVLNAPSPAATAALPIGRMIAGRVLDTT